MEDQLYLLWRVQQLEQRCGQLEKQRNQVNEKAVNVLWEQIKNMKQSIVQEKECLKRLENSCDFQAAVLSDNTAKCQHLEKLLYSSEMKNLKEIEQIKVQYDASKLEVAKLEQGYFKEVDDTDELSKKITLLEQVLEEKKREHAKSQQQITEQIASISAEISNVKTQYQELLTAIEPQLAEKYRMLKQKIKFPIAEMKKGICSGCRMGLPESQAVSKGMQLNYCDHCGRILITAND